MRNVRPSKQCAASDRRPIPKSRYINFVFFSGVTGFDGLFLENARRSARPDDTLIRWALKRANTIVARAKSLVSPYFTADNFAFAYARA